MPASIVLFLAAVISLESMRGQMVPFGRGLDSNQLARFKVQFERGDTNAPLLAMDWFSHGDHFCRVSQSGSVSAALDVGYAIEGGRRVSLDAANMFLLRHTISDLPRPSGQSLPRERQIFVCGIRSNQWFQSVYDRADIPPEVERLFEITGAGLTWFIPEVEGRLIARSGMDRGSQNVINSFTAASDAPVAVSTGANGLQAWHLSKSARGAILPLEKTPYRADLWSIATLSPDGRIIVFTGNEVSPEKSIYAFDWQTRDMLWEIPQVNLGNTYEAGGRVFAIGNHGRSLFISKGNRIEHWDMATGTNIATLITNQTGVKFLDVSRNGKILVAGFGDRSFIVWRTDRDEPFASFTEPEEANCMAVSPEGRKIAVFSYNSGGVFVIWNVQTRTPKEFHLRTPYASGSVTSAYWSPDGKWLAANVDTYPASIVIYQTSNWKPVARWSCEQIMKASRFAFRNDGVFLELTGNSIYGLDLAASKTDSGNRN